MPFRRVFDTDRQAGQSISIKQSWRNLRHMMATPTLRRLILGGMAFVGLQVTFSSFFVSYLADGLGHSLTSAGFIFAVSQSSAIVSRVAWGWIAGRWMSPRMVLGIVGLIMSIGSSARVGHGLADEIEQRQLRQARNGHVRRLERRLGVVHARDRIGHVDVLDIVDGLFGEQQSVAVALADISQRLGRDADAGANVGDIGDRVAR